MSWNLEQGRGDDAWQSLAREVSAELMLLQEASEPKVSVPPIWNAVPGRLWGSAIVVENGSLASLPVLEEYKGWLVGARWHSENWRVPKGAHVFSLHAPTSSKETPRRSYVGEVRSIVDWILKVTPESAPLLIGGDFNFKSLGERVAGESLGDARDELVALSSFREKKLLVAWRDLNPGVALPQTLRWKGNRATPFHCDGYLIRGFDRTDLSCDVHTSERFHRASDHYPVTLTLGRGESTADAI